jgi:hypothetical protein
MALTMAQANQILATISTEAELRNLIAQLDVGGATGKATILYSGTDNGVYSGDLVKAAYENGADIRVLDNTEASRFLSLEFNSQLAPELERIFGTRANQPGTSANKLA